MESLLKKRRVLRGQLTRIENYLMNTSEIKPTYEEVTERLVKLSSVFKELEDIQLAIEMHEEYQETVVNASEREGDENKYFAARAGATTYIKGLPRTTTTTLNEESSSSQSSHSENASELNAAIQQLIGHQTTLAELVTNIQRAPTTNAVPVVSGTGPNRTGNEVMQSSHSEFRLRPMEIPSFNGDYKEWPEFHDLFKNIIHNNVKLSACEKLQYLKGALVGKAQGILRNIPISDANYQQAYEELVKTYDKRDVIIDSYFQVIMDQQKVETPTADSLRMLSSNINESVRALTALKLPTDQWDHWLIFVFTSKLDSESVKLWRRECSQRGDDTEVKFSQLINFINNRVYELTPLKQGISESKKYNKIHINQKTKYSHSSTVAIKSCIKCNGEHGLYACAEFLKLQIKSRRAFVKEKNLCFNCLSARHMARECTSSSFCKFCKGKHNSLLHENISMSKPSAISSRGDHQITGQGHPSVFSSNLATQDKERLTSILPTACIFVKDCWNYYQQCRVLLDTGSQINLISESCVQKLGLVRTNARIAINGVGTAKPTNTRGKVNLKIKSRYNDFKIEANAFILSKVTSMIPAAPLQTCTNKHFAGINLADSHYDRPGKIEIILGCEIFFKILMSAQINNGSSTAMAQETQFGWIISGQCSFKNPQTSLCMHSCIDIDLRLKKFWEMEELSDEVPHTEEELMAEDHFAQNHSRDQTGRYIVRLPFKLNTNNLGSSRKSALYTLYSMEKRFTNNIKLKNDYCQFISDYKNLNHMQQTKLVDINESNTYYMPHHAVIKDSSSTTKLRVVFDASRKSSTGTSLNNLLMVGPTIQNDIWTLLLKFRKFKLAFTADISKMYRQILMDKRDTKFQKILWRDEVTTEVNEYELLTVTYGTASAPFSAVRVLKQLSIDEGMQHPIGAKNLNENFYVDDFMGGAHTLDQANIIKHELTELLSKGGFDLRKWSSNSEDFLNSIPIDHREESFCLPLQVDTTIKALGLRWQPAGDWFVFEINLDQSQVFTKRSILSEVSKIYDPLGFLAPCTVVAKLILQQIWITGLGWDDPLSDDIGNTYNKFRKGLQCIPKLQINRWLGTSSDSEIQLCGFSDASESAYAAAIYLRVVTQNCIQVNLLVAKTRVAPIAQISLPRLELCGAHLLAKLMAKVKSAMDVTSIDTYAFTDSTVVLAWLKAIPRKWKTYIANRTSKILSIIPFREWRHVRSAENAADPASRGILGNDLQSLTLWWKGPAFLHTTDFHKSIQPTQNLETNMDERIRINVLHTTVENSTDETQKDFIDIILNRFSSLQKLITVISICQRFIKNLKLSKENISYTKKIILSITVSERQEALQRLIILTQYQDYKKDIEHIKLNKILSKQSKLTSLMPFLDDSGILRVGGRIRECDGNFNKKHPIILSSKNILTTLIIHETHAKYFHANQQLMINIVNMRYWIMGVKIAVRKCIRKCVDCNRYRAEGYQQQMGNLPCYRVQPSRPFSNTGTDFAGPFQVRAWKGRGAKQFKAYVALFVCMATKGIHLELVTDLSADMFLAALHRFTSRRGICSNIYSDNGRNFVGAARKLSEFQTFLEQNFDTLTNTLAKNHINWHFIPAYSPNFGGIWEAAVKAMKYHIKRSIGETILTFEELSTLLCQIEGCLNSRPIGPLSYTSSDDPEPLTPGHFLTQGPIMLPPQETISESSSISTRWELVQRIHASFWKRWNSEYLATLQKRTKWFKQSENLQIGDIVLIKDENQPPCRWLMGHVISTTPGRDGLVRVATLKTKNGIIDRTIRKLVVFLPKTQTDENSH